MTVQTILQPRWIMTLDCISRPTNRLPDLSSTILKSTILTTDKPPNLAFTFTRLSNNPYLSPKKGSHHDKKGNQAISHDVPRPFRRNTAPLHAKRDPETSISFGMHTLFLWAHKAQSVWLAGGRARIRFSSEGVPEAISTPPRR